MLYTILKAVHIIFMVSYFAGIFYLVRLFVYYKDTDEFEITKQQILREQYVFMAGRLWNIITVPAFVIMLLTGISLIFVFYPNVPLLTLEPFSWFYLKIIFLFGLFYYHYWCWKKVLEIKHLNGGTLNHANIKLRQANEVATFLLFLIVFTVILKSAVLTYWWQLMTGFIVLVVVIMLIVKTVNANKRKKK